MREPITQQIAAIILESETYLNIYNTPKNIIANISSKIGFTPKTTPALVATAFPPLNLRYIGYTWPSIANKPTINPCVKNVLSGPSACTGNQIGKNTVINPLNISKKVTINPAGLPRTRKLLVAPVLPLPYCLISFEKLSYNISIRIAPMR